MGRMLQLHGERYTQIDGTTDLERLYWDCCKTEGYVTANKNSKRAAAVSPQTRSPSGTPVNKEKGFGVRASIRRAINESRGQI
jgi:hypothetical protein